MFLMSVHRGETAPGFSDDWGDIYVKYQSQNSYWGKLISSGPSLMVIPFIGLFALGFFVCLFVVVVFAFLYYFYVKS